VAFRFVVIGLIATSCPWVTDSYSLCLSVSGSQIRNGRAFICHQIELLTLWRRPNVIDDIRNNAAVIFYGERRFQVRTPFTLNKCTEYSWRVQLQFDWRKIELFILRNSLTFNFNGVFYGPLLLLKHHICYVAHT